MLPILTFDEARLSPSHGYIFNRRWLCPHETILGIAWKLARMNAMPGHIVAKQVALRADRPLRRSSAYRQPCCRVTPGPNLRDSQEGVGGWPAKD